MDSSIQWGIASVCGVTGALLLLMMILCSRSYKRRKKLSSNQVNNDPTHSLQLRDLGQRQSTRYLHDERRSDRKKQNEGEIMSRDNITQQNGNSESDIQGGKSNKERSSFFVKKTEANQNKLSENTHTKNGRSSFFAKKTQTDQKRRSANRSSKIKKDEEKVVTKGSDNSLISDSFVKTIPGTQGGSINEGQSTDQCEHSTNVLFSRSKSLVFSRSQDKGDRVSFHSLQNFPVEPVRIPRARLPSVEFQENLV